MRPELQASVEKFTSALRVAERERKFMKLHFGLSNPQIAALVQGSRGTLDTFAQAAMHAARRRLEKR